MKKLIIVAVSACSVAVSFGQEPNRPRPPEWFTVKDVPNDHGEFLEFSFGLSEDHEKIQNYVIWSNHEDRQDEWFNHIRVFISNETEQDTTKLFYLGDTVRIFKKKEDKSVSFKLGFTGGSIYHTWRLYYTIAAVGKFEYYDYPYHYSQFTRFSNYPNPIRAIDNIPPQPVDISTCRVYNIGTFLEGILCKPSISDKIVWEYRTVDNRYYITIDGVAIYEFRIDDNPQKMRFRVDSENLEWGETEIKFWLGHAIHRDGDSIVKNENGRSIYLSEEVNLFSLHRPLFFRIYTIDGQPYNRLPNDQRDNVIPSKIGILSPAPEYNISILGDLDEDKDIDFADFLIFISKYNTTDQKADFDGDGIVGFSDFLLFVENFGDDIQ